MILFPLMECCEQLAIDPKTLRHWLEQAMLSPHVPSTDRRRKCLTLEQVQHLAVLHNRILKPNEARPTASLVKTPPLGTQQEPPHPHVINDATVVTTIIVPEEENLCQKLSSLEAQVVAQQQQLILLTRDLLRERATRTERHLSSADAHTQLMRDAEMGGSQQENITLSIPLPHGAGRPLHPAEQRARFLVLPPLIEYSATGTYVVISSRGAEKCLSSQTAWSGLNGSEPFPLSVLWEHQGTLERAGDMIVGQNVPGMLIGPSISMSIGSIWG